jgi:hemin uptake protein HemP
MPPSSTAAGAATLTAPLAGQPPVRLTTAKLMQGQKEIEIEHAGKIYRLRVTQLNKLILTA